MNIIVKGLLLFGLKVKKLKKEHLPEETVKSYIEAGEQLALWKMHIILSSLFKPIPNNS